MQNGSTSKLITCILPPGVAADVVRRLRTDHGIAEANVHTARGISQFGAAARQMAGPQTEREVLTVVVPAGRADELFAFLFRATGVDRPHGGLLFMSRLGRSTPLTLPEAPEET
jgi:hypothetical protein